MTTAALVLAGGGGLRFGGLLPKVLAPFRGRPLVLWQGEAALAAALDETVVVDGAADLTATVPPGVTLLHNRAWAEGQATSLLLGVEWCREQGHGAVVVGLGDQPLTSAEAWAAVAKAPPFPLVVATYRGRRGHPVRISAEMWPLLPPAGDEGARRLFAARPNLVWEVPCPGNPADVDTSEDLANWE